MIPPNLALIAWIPLVVYLFRWLPPVRAFIVSNIFAFQYLPQFVIILPATIPFAKMSVTTYGVIIGTLLFDVKWLRSFRLHWLDLPMLAFCLCPIFSYMANDLGLVEGLKAAFADTISWGAPYLLGRVYLSDLDSLRKLAVGIFIGGLSYIPFCTIENFMGPLLHEKVYGFPAFIDWSQAKRWGGWRPVVFMQHGLQVGFWMMAATLIGIWLWKTGVLRQLAGVPIKWLAIIITFSFLAVRSTGAWGLLILGIVILFSTRWFRSSVLLLVLILFLYGYVTNAMFKQSSRDTIVSALLTVLPEDRVASIDFRLANEEILAERARERFWFGWAGNGRNMVRSRRDGEVISVTDSYWIIVFGIRGTVGVYSWLSALLLPIVAFIVSFPSKLWSHRQLAPVASLAVVIVLYIFDCTLNAMLNPIFTIAAGGISGLVIRYTRTEINGLRLTTAANHLPKHTEATYTTLPGIARSIKAGD